MLHLSDARHFRRLVAGFCLIAAPVVLLVGAMLHPQSKEAAAQHIAVVADNPGRYYAAHAIILVGLALFLPAILGLMHLLRERATTFAHLGGGLAMIGVLGATAVVAVDGIVISQMGQPDANVERDGSSPRSDQGVGRLSRHRGHGGARVHTGDAVACLRSPASPGGARVGGRRSRSSCRRRPRRPGHGQPSHLCDRIRDVPRHARSAWLEDPDRVG